MLVTIYLTILVKPVSYEIIYSIYPRAGTGTVNSSTASYFNIYDYKLELHIWPPKLERKCK
jgi:hypothetical protein